MKDMLTSLILNIDTSYEEWDEIISCKTEYIDPYKLFDSFTDDELEECINDIYLEALNYDIDYQNNIEIYLDYLDYISQKDEDIFDDEDDKIGCLKYNDDNKFDYFEDIPSKEEIEEYFGRHTLDDELIDIVKFEDDMYRSWIDWCNDKYADVDEDENVYLMEEDWWNEYKDSFKADDYIK